MIKNSLVDITNNQNHKYSNILNYMIKNGEDIVMTCSEN